MRYNGVNNRHNETRARGGLLWDFPSSDADAPLFQFFNNATLFLAFVKLEAFLLKIFEMFEL